MEPEPDLMQAFIRQKNAYFMQAFELIALLSQEVIQYVLFSLSENEKTDLVQLLQTSLQSDYYMVSSQRIFAFIAEHSPLQGIREIYGKLYSLTLWGYSIKKYRNSAWIQFERPDFVPFF